MNEHQGVSRFGNFSRSTSEYYRGVHWAPEVPNVKEFFKNIHSLPAGLSFKLTNQVAGFMQSANSSEMKFGIGKMGSSEFDFNLKNVNYPSRGTTSCLLLHQKCFLGAPNSPLNFCQKFYQKRYSKCFGLLCSQFQSNMQVSYHFGKLTPCLQWY